MKKEQMMGPDSPRGWYVTWNSSKMLSSTSMVGEQPENLRHGAFLTPLFR